MHELSICRGLLEQLGDIARHYRQPTIRRITLRIGPLAGVEPALLQQAFAVAKRESIAAGAELHIEEAPLCVYCPDCQSIQPTRLPQLSCPVCGSEATRLHSGDELLLVSVSFPEEI